MTRSELIMSMQICCMNDEVIIAHSGAEKRKKIAEAMLQVVLDNITDIVYIENKHGNALRSDRIVLKEEFRRAGK